MLHVNDLTYRIGDRAAPRPGLASRSRTGARVGLVGRNGAGKTTLFRIILGEIAPEGGDVSLPRACAHRRGGAGGAGRAGDA